MAKIESLTGLDRTKYWFWIGIDTGVKTGYAVYQVPGKRLLSVRTLLIHEAMQRVADWAMSPRILVRVEDARQAKFRRQKDAYKAQGAGSVKRDAKVWEDFLLGLGIDFQMVRPVKSITKLKVNAFERLTGWSAPVTSHSMDAAMLVYGY
ncbi:MAG TPA: hypothetical protein VFE32_17285 [Puia sp.]|jgi:hypothetical protein|nr:hypothetical protein [Puia sp.]